MYFEVFMNFLLQVFFDNFFTISLALGMIFLILSGKSFDKKITKLFFYGVMDVLLLVVVDSIDLYLSKLPTVNNFRYISSSLGYVLRPALLVIICSILIRKMKRFYVVLLPVVLLAIVVFTNYYTNIMFYFDSNNLFFRGPLGFLSHIVSAIYMLLMIFFTIKQYKNIDIFECLTIFYIMIICAFATFLESFFDKKFVLTGAMIVSLAIYYIYLYVQVYKRDALTNLLNRRAFYNNIEKLSKQKLAVISIDLNCLKTINDTKGHSEGDKAIITIANVAVKIGKRKFVTYRTGGDEFIVIGKQVSMIEVKKFIQEFKDELLRTPYSASFGYAEYLGLGNFDEICNLADNNMYKEKRTFKSNQSDLEIIEKNYNFRTSQREK